MYNQGNENKRERCHGVKLLILGGTVFLGYHTVQSAVRAEHEVTIFTRGRTNSDGLPEDIERLQGDRDGNLTALAGRRWDAVIDTSGYVPRIVRDSVRMLADRADHYTFVSSVSVYSELHQPGAHEETPVLKLENPTSEDVPQHYGALKALCEKEVLSAMPARSLIIRPGLIVGPRDPSDRFTYWPTRVRRGGTVLAPGNPEAQVQFIDVRDLADWMIRMVEARNTGTYNASGPNDLQTMAAFLEKCRNELNPQAELEWVDQAFLLEHGVGPWIEMHLWIPGVGETADVAYLMAADLSKALDAGLTFRPLRDTLQDTADWDAGRPVDLPRKAGMSEQRETELLEKWREFAG
jgi:2'-hydroxyisoflavone reductase